MMQILSDRGIPCARPLTDFIPTPMKQRKGPKKKEHVNQKPLTWGPEQDRAFRKLCNILSSPPVIGYANYSKPLNFTQMLLEKYSELLGFLFVLFVFCFFYQEQDGRKRVISYVSRALKKAKQNYPAHNWISFA